MYVCHCIKTFYVYFTNSLYVIPIVTFLYRKEVISHATCRTYHVVYCVISSCPVALIAVRRYVIVENARRRENVNNHALMPDLHAGIPVLPPATRAPPVHPVPAVLRYSPSLIQTLLKNTETSCSNVALIKQHFVFSAVG